MEARGQINDSGNGIRIQTNLLLIYKASIGETLWEGVDCREGTEWGGVGLQRGYRIVYRVGRGLRW